MADWQSIAVFVCIATAALYLARQIWRRATKHGGCGGCGTCPSNAANKDSSLVSLDASFNTPKR
jgi:hypothetical protein